MKCPRCGMKNPNSGRFCGKCGAPIQAAGSASPMPQPAPYPLQADPNITLVKPRIRTKLPSFVRDCLWPGEEVLAAFSASIFDHHRRHDFRHDKFALTTERLIAYRTALVHKAMNEMPYRTIAGVHYNRGFAHGKVIVDGANFGMTLDRIGNDDASFAEMIIAGSLAGRRFTAQR